MKKIILNKELLYQTYITEGKTIEESADKLGVCRTVIIKNLRFYQIPTRTNKKQPIKKEILIDLYQNKLLSIRDVAKILNVYETQVRSSLKIHRIPRRNKSWKSSLNKNGKNVCCAICGKMVYRKKFNLNKFNIFFCSWSCAKEYQSLMRKSNLPESWRSRREYKKWRKEILTRDNKTCKICGSNIKVIAHHIIEAQDNIELRYEKNNGITLCEKCHIEIHAKNSHNYIESLQKAIFVENPNIGETPEVDNPEA